MFKNESQLRKLMRAVSSRKLWWIEPNLGSTNGLPDCFTLKEAIGRMVFAELKKGEMSNGGILTYEVRRSQKEEIPQLIAGGAAGIIAVAEVGRSIVHCFNADWEEVRNGRVDMLKYIPGMECEIEVGSVAGKGVFWRIYDPEAREALRDLGVF